MKHFFWVLSTLISSALLGCGSGGGGGADTSVSNDSPVVNPTVRRVERLASGFDFSALNTNGYVALLGSTIYVSDASKIWSLNLSGQVNLLDTQIVTDPRGLTAASSSLYYAGSPQGDSNIYLYPSQTSRLVNIQNYNFGSLAAFGNDLYAIDFSSGSGAVLKFTNKIGTGSSVASLIGSSYITSDASYIYATKQNGGATYFNPSSGSSSSWTGLTNPKGIAIAGSYAYVVSEADNNGNGAVILRVKLSDGTVDTYVDGQTLGAWDPSLSQGFCGPSGIAANTQDGYLYVINGFCTGITSNANSLLRIKI